MGIYVPRWSIEEYEANEPRRLPSETLNSEQFYYLGLPNKGGHPDAYRALIQLENIQRNMSNVTFGLLFYTQDFQPYNARPVPSVTNDDYWTPQKTVRFTIQNKPTMYVSKGYFIPYDDPVDDEFKKVTEALQISHLLDNYV